MRAGIVVLLSQGPLNANQIAQRMGIDYKTVRHHLNVLVKNKAVVMWGERYGLLYFISDHLRESYPIFQRVRGKVEQPNAKGVWWEVE